MRAVRLHQLLLVAAILVPAALFAGAAVESRRDVLREGHETVQRTASILHEHARKVFETQELVIGRIADRIDGMTDAQIAAPDTSAFLAALKTPLEQAVSIWIAAADGTILAGSQSWKRYAGGIAGRDFFEAQRQRDAGLYVSGAFEGKATRIASFAISRRRPSADGSFIGTIHVAISPEYFRHFFAEAGPPYPCVAALVRADGEILARYPARPEQRELAGSGLLRRAMADHQEAGTFAALSPFDGKLRFNAFRKLGAYPVYVRFGVEQQVLLQRWYRNLLVYGAFAACGAVVLLLVSWFALSRARAEETALLRLREETEQRLQAEERLRHAQRLEALGQLAGGIAHDFNNVLQAVTGGAALIEAHPDDPKAAKRFARMILDAGQRGASVTGRLLAFARRSDLRAEAVDVALLFNGLREIFAHALGSMLQVKVEVAPDLPPLLADLGQLETVLVNLATNARDAMPDGGTLTLAADAAKVVQRPDNGLRLAPGCYVRLLIRDTGTGMSTLVLARASDPFFTTKEPGKGTGLGLAMARGFAEQSGGTLQIESKPGAGTTVTLWLPRATAAVTTHLPERSVPAAQPARADNRRRKRVLLVDDEPVVMETMARQLEEAGFCVLARPSGVEALETMRTEAVDVLVTDLSMAGMDGLELIRAAQRRIPDLPAILLTGYSGDGATLAIGNSVSGSFTLLHKPVQRTQLADRIAMMLPVSVADAI